MEMPPGVFSFDPEEPPTSDMLDFLALRDVLYSERLSPRMMLSGIDGFITGVAIGPEPIPPEEWLPVIWGGQEPAFADEAEARAVFGALIRRHGAIVNQVNEDRYRAITWFDTKARRLVRPWADGFMEAMTLRAAQWSELVLSEEHVSLILPIMALASEGVELRREVPKRERREFLTGAADALPSATLAIAKYWQGRRDSGGGERAGSKRRDPMIYDLRHETVRFGPRPGRNDPCPCGSGKKFKKCCLAAEAA
jgi:uncharacterized protein